MSELQVWLSLIGQFIAFLITLIITIVKLSNRAVKVEMEVGSLSSEILETKKGCESTYSELKRDMLNLISEVKKENNMAISEVKKDLQIHEMNNERTYSRIENEVAETKREIKQANGKLDELLGYYKAKNGQGL
jgi:LysM repeat protein